MFAWVIEHADSPGYAPRYWSVLLPWPTDSLKALRFAREEDAINFRTKFIGNVVPGCRVAEHGWLD